MTQFVCPENTTGKRKDETGFLHLMSLKERIYDN